MTGASAPHLDSEAPLAPRWHTALIVTLMQMVGSLGLALRLFGQEPAPGDPSTKIGALYVPEIVVETVLALWCVRIFRGKSALGALIGKRWDSVQRFAIDLVCAVGLVVLIVGSETLWAQISGAKPSEAVLAILPSTPLEKAVWVLVALSAGVGEEIVYRGYLYVQLSAFLRSRTAGIVGQALLFGLAHAQQGVGPMLRFSVYGVAFALVAIRRRSLLAGIVAHTLIDASSGLLHH